MRQLLPAAAFVVVFSWPVLTQQPPVKTLTTGVLVDVTAVDRNGKAIVDMTPEEFEISEDGVRQQILSVTLVQSGVARAIKPGAGTSTGQMAGYDPGASGAAAGDATPSVTAILFDRLSNEARPLARKAALAYVQTLTPPRDYAGVFLADLSLRTFQPFTNQQQSLSRAIDQLAGTAPANTARLAEQGSPRVQGLEANQPTTAGAESAGGFLNALDREKRLKEMDPIEAKMARMELRMREGYQHFLAELEGQSSLAGLGTVVSAMTELPGRKSILYFTENLPITSRLKPKFDALIGEANRGNITVYPVDAVGLRVHSQNMELSNNVGVAGAQGIGDAKRGEGAWTKELENQEQMLSSRATAVLGRLAKDTGGFLLENTNDLSAGVARMQQERTTYYLIGYQPTNTKLDGTFRKVSVKVKRGKVTVRARPGYAATARR